MGQNKARRRREGEVEGWSVHEAWYVQSANHTQPGQHLADHIVDAGNVMEGTGPWEGVWSRVLLAALLSPPKAPLLVFHSAQVHA